MINQRCSTFYYRYALVVPLTMNILEEGTRGFGLAYYNTLGNVGALLGPLIIGIIVDKTHNYKLVLIVLGIVSLYGTACSIFIREKPREK